MRTLARTNSDSYYLSMRVGVEWALHCCTLLAALGPGEVLPAARLAEFHDVPPAYLAKTLRDLVTAGVIQAIEGRAGGYRLARAPADITLLDIVSAVGSAKPAFTCTEIRRRGPCAAPSGYAPVCRIAAAMYRAEQAWRNELAAQTIADISNGLSAEIPAQTRTMARRWLRDAAR